MGFHGTFCDFSSIRTLVYTAAADGLTGAPSRGQRNVESGTWFKKGSGTVVRSTLRAVPATVPDPFLNHAEGGTLVNTMA